MSLSMLLHSANVKPYMMGQRLINLTFEAVGEVK